MRIPGAGNDASTPPRVDHSGRRGSTEDVTLQSGYLGDESPAKAVSLRTSQPGVGRRCISFDAKGPPGF